MTPPQPRRARVEKIVRRKPSIFGVNSTTIVKMNSAVMRGASNRGQSGNSWKLRLKYSGRISVACSVSASRRAAAASTAAKTCNP